jgi:type I restriction enzyme S subunit
MSKLKEYKFSDLYAMSSGISSKPEQAGHGFPFVSFSTVFNNYFLPDALPDLMDTSEQEQEKYSIQKGDILLTRTSETIDELGMSCVALKDYPTATYSGFVKRLRPTQKDITYDKYMGFYLRSKYFRKTMTNNAFITLRASLNEAIFSYINLYLPDFRTQKKIGDFLHLLNTKIELNQRINAELESLAKTLYDYWFVQFDFPNEKGKPYKSAGGKMVWNEELKREIPLGWEVGVVSNIVANIKEVANIGANPNLPYIPIDNLPMKKLISAVSSPNIDAKSSLVLFKKYDILLGAMRVYFHRVCMAIQDGITRTTVFVLRPQEDYLKYYSLFTINTTDSIGFAKINSKGTTMPYTFWENGYENFRVVIPPKDLLASFNKIIEPILEKSIVNELESQTLTELRDWLLPMLMNGQVKVG